MTSKIMGYKIKFINNIWIFSDTGKPVENTWKERKCGYCGKERTIDGHDDCLGTLPFVMNACCGHGRRSEAYIQFNNGIRISGTIAVVIARILCLCKWIVEVEE